MNTILTFIPVVSTILAICVTVGGLYAVKQGYSKESGEAQGRLITSMKAEMDILRDRIVDLEKRNTELEIRQETIIVALDKKNIKVTIDGTMVTIVDRQGSSSMRGRSTRPATVQPIRKEKQEP